MNIDFKVFEDTTFIKDSMQMDSGTVIASLKIDGQDIARIEVCGEVRVCFENETYSYPSEFPQELKDLIASSTIESPWYLDERVDIQSNNWFEIFCKHEIGPFVRDIDGATDVEGYSYGDLYESLAEIVNEVRGEEICPYTYAEYMESYMSKSRNGAWLRAYETLGVSQEEFSYTFTRDAKRSKDKDYSIISNMENPNVWVGCFENRLEIHLEDNRNITIPFREPKDVKQYADYESETLTERTYVNGNSRDTLRLSSPEEARILQACIGGALMSVKANASDLQTAMDVAEYIVVNAGIENINSYDSVYNKIRFCPEKILKEEIQEEKQTPSTDELEL